MLLETVDINSRYLRSIGLKFALDIFVIWLIWLKESPYLEIRLYVVGSLVSLRVDVGNVTHLSLVVRINKCHCVTLRTGALTATLTSTPALSTKKHN